MPESESDGGVMEDRPKGRGERTGKERDGRGRKFSSQTQIKGPENKTKPKPKGSFRTTLSKHKRSKKLGEQDLKTESILFYRFFVFLYRLEMQLLLSFHGEMQSRGVSLKSTAHGKLKKKSTESFA